MKNIYFDLAHMSKFRSDTVAAKLYADDDTYLDQVDADSGLHPPRVVNERRQRRALALKRVFHQAKAKFHK